MDRYKITGHLSAGAHGLIFKATKRKFAVNQVGSTSSSDHLVAIKRITIRQKGKIPLPILREIKTLQLLTGHMFVVNLIEWFPVGLSVNLVFPLLPTNFNCLLYEEPLTDEQKEAYIFMMVTGMSFIHSKGIIHRDLKPSNLLISWAGILKIADFGQARLSSPGHPMSHQVSTRWYRAPELLYGADIYDKDVDMWSIGCIMFEVFCKEPLFSSDSDIGQLSLVVSSLGPPPPEWADSLPDYHKISFHLEEEEWDKKKVIFHERMKEGMPVPLLEMAQSLCCYKDRVDTDFLLGNEVFSQFKGGVDVGQLPKPKEIKHFRSLEDEDPDTLHD